MPAKCLKNRGIKGFTLIEILIVILIMAIVIGVVGSLMAGYIRMFNETDDQATARRRAQDVFNALEVPVLNASIGIPRDLTGYFAAGDVGNIPPAAAWASPIDIRSTSSYNIAADNGNVLRIIYSLPANVRNNNMRYDDFVASNQNPLTNTSPEASVLLMLTGPLSADMFGSSDPKDLRHFITFPRAFVSPLRVTNLSGNSISVAGKRHPQSNDALLTRGEVYPYDAVHLVRAIVAYVDSDNVFHAAEVNESDPSTTNPTLASNTAAKSALGLRVEGIKAVSFSSDAARKTITVRVLAEGEIFDQMRMDSETRTALRSRWPLVATWDDQVYYEDFEMTWRTRNYGPVN